MPYLYGTKLRAVGPGDDLDQLGLSLRLHLWECGQGEGKLAGRNSLRPYFTGGDVQVRIPGRPPNKLRARTLRTRADEERQDEQGRTTGRTARQVNGQDGKAGQWSGWTRKDKDSSWAGQTWD